MPLEVVEISITDKNVKFLRIPRGKENDFCMGVSETYPLSEKVKINIEGNEDAEKSKLLKALEVHQNAIKLALETLENHNLMKEEYHKIHLMLDEIESIG